MKVQRVQPRPVVRRVRFVTPITPAAAVPKAAVKAPRRRFLPFAGVTMLVMAAASVALVGFTYRKPVDLNLEASMANIPFQTFSVDASADLVINGSEGSIFAFPEGAFVDELGNEVKGNVTVRIKEARNLKDILKGNLTTLTGGSLLATDGMYYIEASQGGKPLKLNPSVGVYASFPTTQKDGQMGLYAGESDKDGLNWKLLGNEEKSIPMCDRDEESRKMCKRCEKLAKMSKRIKTTKAPTSYEQFFEDRYYWQNGKLMFASSGAAKSLFTEEELKDCEQYLKTTEQGQALLAKVDKIRKDQEANSPEYYSYQLSSFGWYNIDKLVKDEIITFSGKVKDSDGALLQKGQVHLISGDPTRKVHTMVNVEGGNYEFAFAKGVEFHLFVVSGDMGGTASFTVSKDGESLQDLQVEKLDLAAVDQMLDKVL
jgi:hypothetical protein